MSSSAATFPARFAELVYLLAHQPDAAAEQEHVLGAAVGRHRGVDASLTTTQLNVDLLDEGQSYRRRAPARARDAHVCAFGASDRLSRGDAAGSRFSVSRGFSRARRGRTMTAPRSTRSWRSSASRRVEVHLGRNGFVRTGSMTPTASPRVAGSTGTYADAIPWRCPRTRSVTPRSSADDPDARRRTSAVRPDAATRRRNGHSRAWRDHARR